MAKQEFLECRGRKVSTYRWGTGPAVILVHGWNGSVGQMTPLVSALVGLDHQVIALDAPAHGRSQGRRTDAFEIAEALAVLEKETGPFVGMVTHSMGALVCATAMAGGGLEHIERAVCLAPAVDQDSLLKGFARILHLPSAVLANLRRRLTSMFPPEFWEVTMFNFHTLIIHDLDDDFIPPSDAKELAQEWPQAELFLTRGLGHRGVLRDAGVIDRVAAFVTQD